MTTDRVAEIEARLNEAFSPTELLVKNQSHLHAGHEGAKDGLGHFEIIICSEDLAGKSRIEAHRLVYDALGELMQTDIHALKINVR